VPLEQHIDMRVLRRLTRMFCFLPRRAEALNDSRVAEGACLLVGEARAPVGGEPWATAEVPIAVVAGGEVGGMIGALMMWG
jgi:hypothetical protein